MTAKSSYHSTNPEIQILNEQSKKYADQIMEIVDEVQKVIVGQEQVIKKTGDCNDGGWTCSLRRSTWIS